LLQSGLVSLGDDNWVKSLSGNPAAEPVANETHHKAQYLHLPLNITTLNAVKVLMFYTSIKKL